MNAGDLIDTGWLRRLTLSAALLLLLGIAAWYLWPVGTPLAWVGALVVLLALVPLGMQLLQLRALHRTAQRQLQAATQHGFDFRRRASLPVIERQSRQQAKRRAA